MITAPHSYVQRRERPLAIDGIAAVADRLQGAFKEKAIEVAERWADEVDIRYRAVANLLRKRAEAAHA